MTHDLAPFVAAVIRDEVVHDLNNELLSLRSHYERVELTGRRGSPVFCSAPFASGAYASEIEWSINLEKVQDGMPFLLGELPLLEVRLAGMVRAIFNECIREGFVLQSRYNKDTGMAENISFCLGFVAGIWISMDIEMSYDTFVQFKDHWDEPTIPGADMMSTLFLYCPRNARVKPRKINFFTDKIEGAMRAWGIPPYKSEVPENDERGVKRGSDDLEVYPLGCCEDRDY